MKLINIGFGNMVSASRVIAIVSPESAPIKRIIQDVRDRGQLIDATYGRRTRAVVIMGTPDFAAASLKGLIDGGFDVVGVFTQPDKPKNRGLKLTSSPVKEIAEAAGIPVFQPEKMRDGTALEMLKSLSPDLVTVVAFGRILPDDMHDNGQKENKKSFSGR